MDIGFYIICDSKNRLAKYVSDSPHIVLLKTISIFVKIISNII